MTGSMRLSRVLLWVAFGILAAFGLLGSLFIIGVTMSDPGGVTGVLLVMLWLVPMAVASTVCLVWPRVGGWVGLGCVALVATLWLWYALDQDWWRSLMDDRGPVIGIVTFALGCPLRALGCTCPAWPARCSWSPEPSRFWPCSGRPQHRRRSRASRS